MKVGLLAATTLVLRGPQWLQSSAPGSPISSSQYSSTFAKITPKKNKEKTTWILMDENFLVELCLYNLSIQFIILLVYKMMLITCLKEINFKNQKSKLCIDV